jgi:hypothetical protein
MADSAPGLTAHKRWHGHHALVGPAQTARHDLEEYVAGAQPFWFEALDQLHVSWALIDHCSHGALHPW